MTLHAVNIENLKKQSSNVSLMTLLKTFSRVTSNLWLIHLTSFKSNFPNTAYNELWLTCECDEDEKNPEVNSHVTLTADSHTTVCRTNPLTNNILPLLLNKKRDGYNLCSSPFKAVSFTLFVLSTSWKVSFSFKSCTQKADCIWSWVTKRFSLMKNIIRIKNKTEHF